MKNRNFGIIFGLCLSLSGCMTVDHLHRDYAGLGTNEVSTPKGAFYIVDNMKTGKLFVEPGFGLSLKGTPPIPWAREAALAWFQKTGRTCTIREGYLFQAPHYEFLYSCAK
ncbi:MAG: hypothetical protein EPN97_10070 [Alphaproteobacteria bacterium]|nr:MAG: hypothetical protein EPN97_10070 [Alphaproteobacteria bacterium]